MPNANIILLTLKSHEIPELAPELNPKHVTWDSCALVRIKE